MEQLHYDGESTSIPLNKMLKVEVIVSGENQELNVSCLIG